MEAKAYLRYVRISPRKIQIVCDLIRGKDVQTAMAILMQTPKLPPSPDEAPQERLRQCGEQLQHDSEKLVVTQVFATPAHPQADDAPRSGPRLSHQ